MGVPAFFKWLMMRYPKVVIDAMQKIDSGYDINEFLRSKYDDESSMPEVDNLYLDMNGIIHPCCHPIDRPQPETEEEMFNAVFEYVDKLVGIIRPKKFIYLAVDGVAPRAKMNQQRSRRFRAALESEKNAESQKNIMKEWKRLGLSHPNELKKKGFDSNTITPGTPFMAKLTDALKIYIAHRLQFHPMWKGLIAVFSDSSVPGEGEHKILEYIRKQRTQTHYDPNTKHCIYGADADLIMLALITHEPHFYIIRESLNENQWKKCDLCGLTGHLKDECKKLNPNAEQNTKSIADIEFSVLKVNVVREYLELEFRPLKIKFEFDLERFIDDFIFLCFFVGNDFIPNLPSLKIREGAIDALLFIYKNEIINLDYYITEGNGKVNLKRAQKIMERLGEVEESFLKSYTHSRISQENRNRQNSRNGSINQNTKRDILYEKFKQLKEKKIENESNEIVNSKNKIPSIVPKYFKKINQDEINLELNEDEGESLKISSNLADLGNKSLNNIKGLSFAKNEFGEEEIEDINKIMEKPEENFQRILKEYLKEQEHKKIAEYIDTIRLGEEGYKERYYQEKFKTSYHDEEFRSLLKKSYVEGICWVFHYYYNGCVSWGWYYPFHYAPFASDLTNIDSLNINFELGEPFQPVEQLLSVLPPYSSYALPDALRSLMYSADSEIIDFFPKDIMLDINGHPFSWMGVNLIPFVDEDRIRKVVKRQTVFFSKEEDERNKFGKPVVFYNSKENDSLRLIVGENFRKESYLVKVSTPNFRIFSAYLSFFDDIINKEKNYFCKLNGLNISIVKDSKIAALIFENAESKPHFSKLLSGVMIPQKIVIEDNLDFYNKRGFKGDQTIKLVNSILKYQNEIENDFKNSMFDRNFNNNRAIEYNPAELEMIKKKRYREREISNNNKHQNFYGDNFHQQNMNYNSNNNRFNKNFLNNTISQNNSFNRRYDEIHPNTGNIPQNNIYPTNSFSQIGHINQNPNFINNLGNTSNTFNRNNLIDLSSQQIFGFNPNIMNMNNANLNQTNFHQSYQINQMPQQQVNQNSIQNLANTYQIYKGKHN